MVNSSLYGDVPRETSVSSIGETGWPIRLGYRYIDGGQVGIDVEVDSETPSSLDALHVPRETSAGHDARRRGGESLAGKADLCLMLRCQR